MINFTWNGFLSGSFARNGSDYDDDNNHDDGDGEGDDDDDDDDGEDDDDMETFCKSWPAACWPPVTFSCASRKSFPRQHVKSTHHHGGDDDSDDVDGDDDDGDDVDGDDQYDNDDLGNKLKAAQGLADFQTFIVTSWQGRPRQSPSFVFGNLSDFLCQSKEGWRHKVAGAEQEI